MFLGVFAYAGASLNGYKALVLKYKDGREALVSLEDDMKIQVKDGKVLMTSSKGSVEANTADLRYWQYSTSSVSDEDNSWAGLTNITADNSIALRIESDAIVISGFSGDAALRIVDLNGRLVLDRRITGGYFRVPSADLHGGIYVLTINDKSFKIALK